MEELEGEFLVPTRGFFGKKNRGLGVGNHEDVIQLWEEEDQVEGMKEEVGIFGQCEATVQKAEIILDERVDSSDCFHRWVERQREGQLKVHAFTDGSVKVSMNKGTYSWVFAEEDDSDEGICRKIWGGGKVSLPVGSELASYRAEAMALLAVLKRAEELFGLDVEIEIHTNNEACIRSWKDLEWATISGFLRMTDKDIWMALQELKRKWQGKVRIGWVKSHVDEKKTWTEMSFEEKGNFLADEGAENMYACYDQLEYPIVPMKLEWVFKVEGKPVTGDVMQAMKDVVKLNKAFRYIKEKGERHSVDIWGGVDWGCLSTLTRRWDVRQRVGYMKLVWGLVATSAILAQRQEEHVDGLPTCKLCDTEESESSWHLFSECPHPGLVNSRKRTHSQICEVLDKVGVEKKMVEVMSRVWEAGGEGLYKVVASEGYREEIRDMGSDGAWTDDLVEKLAAAIGQRWNSRGLLHKAWREALVMAGISDRKSKSTTRKVMLIILEGIRDVWLKRSNIYATLSEQKKKEKQKEVDTEFEKILQSEYYMQRPEVRERLQYCKTNYPMGRKSKLLEKLKVKTRNARVEVVKVGQSFKQLRSGHSRFVEGRLPDKSGGEMRFRVEKLAEPEPRVVLVDDIGGEVDSLQVHLDEQIGQRRGSEKRGQDLVERAGDDSQTSEESLESRGRKKKIGPMDRWLRKGHAPSVRKRHLQNDTVMETTQKFLKTAQHIDIRDLIDDHEGIQIAAMDLVAEDTMVNARSELEHRKGIG